MALTLKEALADDSQFDPMDESSPMAESIEDKLPVVLEHDSPAVKHGKNTVVWNLPFSEGVEEQDVGPSSCHASRRPSIVRRLSSAVVEAASAFDTMAQRGNPLQIEINGVRKISSAGYQSRSKSFVRMPPTPRTEFPPLPAKSESDDSLPEKRLYPDGDDYVIKRLAKFDDIELMPGWKRLLHRLSPILVLSSIAVYWVYFGLRVRLTLIAQKQANTIYGMAWAFILVELFVAMPMIMHRFWCLHATGLRYRPKLRLIGDYVPSVGIIITCCQEDDHLILDTAVAACNIEYPSDRFRVMICDDGRSDISKNMIEKASMEHPNLLYRSRPKTPGITHHFKGGNLNYALAETQQLPNGAADLFAALDADMIPKRDWLRALLPHMLQNRNCAMACLPQLFYNVPVDDPLCQSLNVFANISEPIKDSIGVAWCTGSGYIVRRKALVAVGGFPTGSLAEDVCCSSILLGSGADTAYVHEPLQYGTVPESLESHLKQRTRWTIGTIQTSFKLRFCLYGPLVRHMSFMQRICGFVYTLGSLFTIFLCISMATMPIVLLSGDNMVPYTTTEQLRWLLKACFLSMLLNRINEFIAYRNIHDPISSANPAKERAIRLLTHAGWPPMVWITCILSCCVPIKNGFLPPTVPDREELLARDSKSGVAYPTEWAKKSKQSWGTWLHEIEYSALTLYTTAMFVLSFWI